MEGFFSGKNMIKEFFIEEIGPEVIASFASGGVLARSGDIWSYERDGRSCVAREPETAIEGAEGILNGVRILRGSE